MAWKDKSAMIEYNNNFNREKYDRITVMLPKGYRDKLRSVVGEHGSITAYIKDAIDAKMQEEQA